MAYTPELSYQSACTLRRIAWAFNLPMTKAIEVIFQDLPKYLDPHKICSACRDKTRCSECLFNPATRKEAS
jgi:hypothetical protein